MIKRGGPRLDCTFVVKWAQIRLTFSDLTDKNDIQHLLDSLPEPTLTPRVVSPRVNSVRNNGRELIEPAEPAAK